MLPLSNLSGDAGQDYFVDALTDELTTSISRLPGTFVIARNTAFTFKGKPTDVKAIGKDLGEKYALEGSVQPTATRIRVNAQLIDAETGAHLWAESFDEDRADLLQMEDDIVTRLARTLDLKMIDVEAAEAGRCAPAISRRGPGAAMSARVIDNFADAQDPVKHPELFEFCEQALRLDPGNTRALYFSRPIGDSSLGADIDGRSRTARRISFRRRSRSIRTMRTLATPKGLLDVIMAATMKPSSSSSALSR